MPTPLKGKRHKGRRIERRRIERSVFAPSSVPVLAVRRVPALDDVLEDGGTHLAAHVAVQHAQQRRVFHHQALGRQHGRDQGLLERWRGGRNSENEVIFFYILLPLLSSITGDRKNEFDADITAFRKMSRCNAVQCRVLFRGSLLTNNE